MDSKPTLSSLDPNPNQNQPYHHHNHNHNHNHTHTQIKIHTTITIATPTTKPNWLNANLCVYISIYIFNNFIRCGKRREQLILPRRERERGVLPSRERVFGGVVVGFKIKEEE